ncbi:MAG: hypothetical protein R6W89_09225, partial [Candidatus Hydrogenedentota bacterium]
MKKLAIVAVATMFCAVGAFGVSITVPFFLDNAPADSTFPPSEDTASFIGIRNITDSEINNNFNQTKYTLCVGAPWEATSDNKKYIDMLEKSYQKNKELYL